VTSDRQPNKIKFISLTKKRWMKWPGKLCQKQRKFVIICVGWVSRSFELYLFLYFFVGLSSLSDHLRGSPPHKFNCIASDHHLGLYAQVCQRTVLFRWFMYKTFAHLVFFGVRQKRFVNLFHPALDSTHVNPPLGMISLE